ncbi:MAG: lytic transglycosylase domain-containing protein [Gemmatimonadales bacterium]
MSTDDLREPSARADTSGSPDVTGEALRVNRAGRRPRRLAVPVVAVSALLLISWLGEDVVPPAAGAEGDAHVPGLSIRRLPLEVNARVERWMEELRTNRRAELDMLLERSGVFADLIHSELRERAMPEELLYLAMIESGLSPLAESHVAAVGLWQFMDAAARDYGLRMDDYVDERRDPVRATEAALDYLYWLRARFGSWYLAIAAYNAGPARIERVLELYADGRTGDEALYWEILRHLPRETREYVPRLIATALLAAEADSLGIAVPSSAEPYAYDVVYVPGGTRFVELARSLDVDVGVLEDLNPHLVRDETPPDEMWPLRVPRGRAADVVGMLGRGWSLATGE